jgi:PAS domain S-box-containing protein
MNEKPPGQDNRPLDTSFLTERGIIWARHWLKSRLQGYDALFPIDNLTEEDPSALIVRLLKDNGTRDPGCQILVSLLKELLDECQSQAPHLPGFFRELMHLCEEHSLPGLRDWFTERLAQASTDAHSFQGDWGGAPTAKRIIFAACRQARAKPNTPAYECWKKLLRSPFYGTIALYALGETFWTRFQYLKEWWEACPADQRSDDLEQILGAAWKNQGEQGFIELLSTNAQKGEWSERMRHEVHHALKKHCPDVTLPPSIKELLTESGSKIEVVSVASGSTRGVSYNEAPVPGYEVDAEGIITQVTANFSRLLQLSTDVIVGKAESTFAWDPRAPERKDVRPSIVPEREGFFNYVQKDELNVPAFITSQPLPDSNAKHPGGFFVTLTDLRAENEFRPWPSLMDTRYTKLLDALPFYVLRKDTCSRFIYANKFFRDELRKGWNIRRKGNYRGLTDMDLYGPDIAARYVRDDKTLFNKKKPVEKIEEHRRTKEGQLELVHVIKVPLLGLESEVVGLECVFWFLNQREEALRTLRANQQQAGEQARKVFGSSDIGFFQSTPAGRFLSVNPTLARILGYDTTQAMIKEVQNIADHFFVHPEEREVLKKQLENHDEVLGFVYEVKHKNGSFIRVSEDVRVVRDANSNPMFYEGTIRVAGVSPHY